MKEEWRDIVGYENYQVSSMGRVKSLNYNRTGMEKILKPAKNKDEYLQVALYKQNKRKYYKVHRLVAMAFIDNPQNLEQINHRDECKANNCVSNLEWCTRLYNQNYGTRNQRAAASNTNNPKRSKQVLCIETSVVYPSTMEVYRQLGFSRGNISECCNGKRKTCGGYTWRYVN